MRKIMLNRVLPRSIEVKGHIEEYKVCVRVEEREEENKFTPNKKTIHVYITKKEHS